MRNDLRNYPPNLRPEPGWHGVFTRQEVAGAFCNGTRVVKVAEDPGGDNNPLGTQATVLGSMRHPQMPDMLAYFVEWDTYPRYAVAVMDWKLARLEEETA